MIYNIIEDLKLTFINHPMVSEVSAEPLYMYENKSVKYPFVNIDVNRCDVKNGTIKYNCRIHVLDRQTNAQLTAYNKTEKILNDILKSLGKKEYVINYVTDSFPDVVSGVFIDVLIEDRIENVCEYQQLNGYILTEGEDYVVTENNEYIMLEKNTVTNKLIYFGNSSAIPTNQDEVKTLLNKRQFVKEQYNVVNLTTNDIKVYNIVAVPSYFNINLIEDENNNWNLITNDYQIQQTIEISNYDGLIENYDIYAFVNTNIYNNQHKHIITLFNNNELY